MQDVLTGKRIQIRTLKWDDSVRILDGLAGVVVAMHPIASEWVKIRLDPNPVTADLEWSIPANRLLLCEAESCPSDKREFKVVHPHQYASRSDLDPLFYTASASPYVS